MGIWTAMSLVDVDSIGAGGGSIAWADTLGIMRVGPKSAGADPGPACYGRGGLLPTVTDALLVCSYIDKDRFLGGAMPLDRSAAIRACEGLAKQLSLSAEQVAWGIREISLGDMVKAVRARLTERGLDPKDHAFVSYGGCGGLFTADIARALGARHVLFPQLASVLSAYGAAIADVRRERIRSVGLLLPANAATLRQLAKTLRHEVENDLRADGISEADSMVVFEADLRFRRQRWELTVPIGQEALNDGNLDQAMKEFRTEYGKRYGTGAIVAGSAIELTNLRAVGIGKTLKASLNVSLHASTTKPDTLGTRAVRIDREGPLQNIPVIEGKSLTHGHEISGPALIDAVDTTIWIPPNSLAHMDERHTLNLELGNNGSG